MTEERLGYPFDPTPSWIQSEHEAGLLSDERRDILLALVHRANVQRLRRGHPTPELRVESLATATHRPTSRGGLEALRHLLREMRRDGDLDYTTRGTGGRVVYVFTVTRDRSGVAPPSDASSAPLSEGPQTGSANGIPGSDNSDGSGLLSGRSTVAAPGNPVSTPPSVPPSRPLPEPDRADQRSASTPGSSDVLENPRPASTESEASARAREDDDPPEIAAQYDEFFTATAPKRERGYGWEPNS